MMNYPLTQSLILFLFVLIPFSPSFAQNSCVDEARSHYRAGNYHLTIAAMLSCDEPTADLSAQEMLASAYFLSGDLSSASATLAGVPDSAMTESALSLRSRIAFASADYETARAGYLKLLETDSLNPNYLRQLAASYDKLDSIAPAMDYWQKVMAIQPSDAITGMKLVEKYMALERFSEADSLAATLMNLNQHPALYRLRGDALYALREHSEAFDCYDPLLRKGTSDPELLKKAGICKFVNGETDLAINMFTVVHLVRPDDEIVCYYLGMCYQSLKDYKSSELFLNSAIRNGISKNMGNYLLRLADMYETSGNYEKALDAYQRAVAHSENKSEIYHEIGRVYEVYFSDVQNALRNYRRYLELADDTAALKYKGVKGRVEQLEK